MSYTSNKSWLSSRQSAARRQTYELGVSQDIIVTHAQTNEGHTVVGEVLSAKILDHLAVDVAGVEAWRVQRVGQAVAERRSMNQIAQSFKILSNTLIKQSF